jgi:peptidoglycan glycosyltransferase
VTSTTTPPPDGRPRARGRIAAGLVIAAVLAGAVLAVRAARREADLGRARDALFAGDAAAARALLAPLAGSEPHVPHARAGLAVAGALAGEGSAAGEADGVRAWPLRALLDAAIARRDVSGARGLAALATRAGEPVGPAYEAAARVEAGDLAGARAVLASRPEAFDDGFGRRVRRTLELREAGARVLLDRRGGLLGGVSAEGTFLAEEDVPAGWVPRTMAAAAGAAGDAARLTLDRRLSRIAADALGGQRGTIVLVDVRTGAVLAAATDPHTAAREPDAAFAQRREPASISKIITSTAAQRAGLDPDAEIARMTCTGVGHYGGGTLWCAYPGGPLRGLAHALAISCNTAFANLGVRIGRAALLDELRRYAFDRAELPGAGRIREPEGDERQLADLSVGLTGTEITPVHGALFAAVFAREGAMPEPMLVAARDGFFGRSPEPLAPRPARKVVDPARVPQIVRAMLAVTGEDGTAEGAAPPSYPVAMKTGTASEPGLGYHVNYIGVGPMPSPELAFAVRVTGQPTSARVTAAAREVLAALLARLDAARAR